MPYPAYPAPKTVVSEGIQRILDDLNNLLSNLPAELPCRNTTGSKYGTFVNFNLDEDILDKTGDEVATLGEQLEHMFGWQAYHR